MADDLHEALTDIQGVGDARAEEIEALVDEHATDSSDDVRAHLETALDYADAGNPTYAMKFVRRALVDLGDD